METFGLVLFCWLVLSLCTSVSLGREGVNLGKLHWCSRRTLCLCHDDTQEMMQCFTDTEIYSLLNVDVRKAQRLTDSHYKLAEKLMWCSETCLCHKKGRKEFKCSDKVRLGEFIEEKAPNLAHYLEPEVEIYDLRDISDGDNIENVKEESQEVEPKKERHNKRKKHRKSKKSHSIKEEPTIPSTVTTPPTEEVAEVEEYHENSKTVSQASTGRDLSSRSPPSVIKMSLDRNTVAGEITEDLYDLRDHIDKVKADVALNQHILLATVAFSSLAMLGVMILTIYICCLKKSTKKHCISKSHKNKSLNHEENNVTKVNLTDEAW